MPQQNGRHDEAEEIEDEDFDPAEYDTLMQLERLESLEEEMVEMGVTNLEEVRERIVSLHQQLDAEDAKQQRGS